MRTTAKEVEGVFRLWVKAINGREAKSYSDVGGYRLDYAACYGGWRVERVCNEMGGVLDIFYSRLPAMEFVTALRMSMKSIFELSLNTEAGRS